MKKLGSILLKGLVTILPIGLTVYFVYWLGITTETLLSKPIKWWWTTLTTGPAWA